MRIAMLAPINRRIPPRPYGPEELLISDLTEGLIERGHQVTLFATANSLTRAEMVSVCPTPLVEWEEEPWPEPRWWEDLHISECMSLAAKGHFDLVHNHMHAKGLIFLGALNVPVITSLFRAARDKQIHRILLRYGDYPFVALDQAERELLPELNYVAEIPLPDPEDTAGPASVVESYEELYQGLVSGEVPSVTSEKRRVTPWGRWEVLLDEPTYKVKRIQIRPGKRLSYQRHQKRSELWQVVEGKAVVTLDGKEIELGPGQNVEIPKGAAHRVGAIGDEVMVFIEVQTGAYFGEDDIERIEDDFGRK